MLLSEECSALSTEDVVLFKERLHKESSEVEAPRRPTAFDRERIDCSVSEGGEFTQLRSWVRQAKGKGGT